MNDYKPTDEEFFDYALGLIDPYRSQKITAYLKDHPEKLQEIKEWQHIETTFAELNLASPCENILQRVRETAQAEVATRGSPVAWLQSFFATKKLAAVFTVFVMIGVGIATKKFIIENESQQGLMRATVSEQNFSQKTEPLQNGALEAWAQQEFVTALTFFQKGDFAASHDAFSKITAKAPQFSKNGELYTYWVETLKKLEKYELAEQKQMILEKFETNK